jgi:hypothetical protein
MSKFAVRSVVAVCLRFAPAALVAPALYGCGGVSGTADDSPSAEPSESAIDSIEQAYGESTCVNVLDHQCGTLGSSDPSCIARSPDGNYDHSSCRHTYVAQVNLTSARPVLSIYTGDRPDGTFFPCNSTWVRMTVWRKVGQLWKAFLPDKVVQGFVGNGGLCASPTVAVPTLDPGTYKIMVQAGFLNVYAPVQITVL